MSQLQISVDTQLGELDALSTPTSTTVVPKMSTSLFAVDCEDKLTADPRYLTAELRKVASTKISKVVAVFTPFSNHDYLTGNQVGRELNRLVLVDIHLRKSLGWRIPPSEAAYQGHFGYDLEQVLPCCTCRTHAPSLLELQP